MNKRLHELVVSSNLQISPYCTATNEKVLKEFAQQIIAEYTEVLEGVFVVTAPELCGPLHKLRAQIFAHFEGES